MCPHADVTAHPRSGRLEWQRASLEGEGDGVEGWDRASSGGLQQRAGVGVDGSALGGAEAASHLSEGGAGAQRPLRADMLARSRFNVEARAMFPEAADRRFGVIVESAGPVPLALVVERAQYWDALGQQWAAGTNALGAPLP